MVDKKQMTEEEIKLNFITPAIEKNWNKQQMRMEYFFTDGRINIAGKKAKRGKAKKADYLLFFTDNLPLAVVEAKDNNHTVLGGMQQAITYAHILKVPFVYSSNGDGFVEHDMTTGKEKSLSLSDFPSPEDLWQRHCKVTNISQEQKDIALTPYYYKPGGKIPRYYQFIAINRTLDAIAKGRRRVLIVLATGTGKTFVAFQIMWKLLTAKKVKKILFLADRNILVDQSRDNDFKPLQKVMTKIEKHQVDTGYQVYLSLYQQLKDKDENYYKEFDRDFFDLIIIDECHRSSADENSNWHDILDYFKSAVHIGMTATPRETEDVSNIHYFGDPIYTYSLKQGIEDGFLAPYKVIRVNLDIDVNGFRPYKGMLDKYGNELDDRLYEQKDFDNILVVEERTKTVAKRLSDYLKEVDRYAKTIVFCVDIPHAERMRQALINENSDLFVEDPRYITQITGDNEEGKKQLDNFIDAFEKYPVVVVTSRLMSTGVDAKTCKVIALDRPIGSMTEFKQIIGRGTRVREDRGKMFFTILDFRKNYTKFSDPDFDGEPVSVFDVGEAENFPNDDNNTLDNRSDENNNNSGSIAESGENYGDEKEHRKRKKYIIDGIPVEVINEHVEYLDANGNLITMSIIDYSRMNLKKVYPMFEDFRKAWLANKKKSELLDQLTEDGVFIDPVKDTFEKGIDEYDILSYIGYEKEPLSKNERIDAILRSGYLDKFTPGNQEIIKLLLDEYRTKSIDELMNLKVLELPQFIQINSPMKIVKSFGGKNKYNEMLDDVSGNIYIA
ncbi:EcoAI/FtnUII family type I restriction enzme subunit R [Sporolactobacillus sp. KGMB 08714]|uniref:EcoAI/FtnUII family type I restriction enzme subunit R n=1 Tax=Sporolactobacillus sp. KGMB 08714 TaxID=3064704 RepID=UPI002FBED73E